MKISELTFDTEHMQHYSIDIGSLKASVYEGKEIIHVLWLQDSYYLHITAYGNIDINTLIQIIESIK